MESLRNCHSQEAPSESRQLNMLYPGWDTGKNIGLQGKTEKIGKKYELKEKKKKEDWNYSATLQETTRS